MRNKVLALAMLTLLLPALAAAQEETRRNQVVSLVEGGFVAFKSEIAPAGQINASTVVRGMPSDIKAHAFVDENHVIHRVLADATGKYIFAYDVIIQAVPRSKMFNIAVGPLDAETEKKLLASSADRQPVHIATLPQSAEPHILDDGDSIALDLLVNQRTGLKIVDIVKVSFDRGNFWEERPGTLPRDFTLEAVALRMVDFRLLVDGQLVGAGKPGTDFTGALLWCYVEGQGRLIFSLVPREGYQFHKVGVITDNRIEFTLKGKRFEWLSSAPILPSGGSWNLWVLHDPKYLPFGAIEILQPEKSRLEKLDDSIKATAEKVSRIGDPAAVGFVKKPEAQTTDPEVDQSSAKRFRVMVGAADRMENLLPK
ncbi:MAG TPA: hypothetical protein VGN90_14940 [Pyrinomonadaceae bacterium]|jgi:hypothetical protein|nr:hypothetical protein [Pyrinomonadaceae bacterium]